MRGDPCIDCNRIAAGIARRAYPLAKAKLEASTPTPLISDQSAQAERLALDLDPDLCTRTLPEAPASVNYHITIAGRQVQVTLRDTDEAKLLARLEALLARFPVEAPTQATPVIHPPASWCAKYQCVMKENQKDGRTWYSHRLADGWCKGK